jgi:four helix bundle protein
MEEKALILTKSYDLLKATIQMVGKFPRDQKFLLGDRMQQQAGDILENLIEAYYAPAEKKLALLHPVNIRLEKLRYYARLCFELGFYSSKKLEAYSEQLLEICRMTGGWIKSLQKK